MDQTSGTNGTDPTIRDLYPHATDQELEEAEEFFMWYADFTLRMYERIAHDPTAYREFKALTAALQTATMESDHSPV